MDLIPLIILLAVIYAAVMVGMIYMRKKKNATLTNYNIDTEYHRAAEITDNLLKTECFDVLQIAHPEQKIIAFTEVKASFINKTKLEMVLSITKSILGYFFHLLLRSFRIRVTHEGEDSREYLLLCEDQVVMIAYSDDAAKVMNQTIIPASQLSQATLTKHKKNYLLELPVNGDRKLSIIFKTNITTPPVDTDRIKRTTDFKWQTDYQVAATYFAEQLKVKYPRIYIEKIVN